jgi:histidinol phosphatase-like enzyme
MNKILDVMEDIKQNITDNQYKIIMDSLMEIKNGKEKEERVTRLYYTQNEFDEMTKVMVKLTIKQFFEYTDDENDVVWLDSIKNLIGSYYEKHKIGLYSYRLDDYILEILKNNNTIIIGDFFKKIKHRK